MSKLMRNRAAIPGGDSIVERGTSIPRDLGDSGAIVKESGWLSHAMESNGG